jgi:predicted DNA-binding protein
MRTFSVRLTDEIEEKARKLKEKTGVSEAVIIRHAVAAGLPIVEQGLDFFTQKVVESATINYTQKEQQ